MHSFEEQMKNFSCRKAYEEQEVIVSAKNEMNVVFVHSIEAERKGSDVCEEIICDLH